MPAPLSGGAAGAILLIGASRGLGHGMAAEFLTRGWNVVGTVRDADAMTPLHDLASRHRGRVVIETLDVTVPALISTLRDRLADCAFQMLFVNAGAANRHPGETAAEISTDEFVRVMVTNALGVMRAVEGLQELVAPDGVIGVMSSGQGSIANNAKGGNDIYRASKAALNQLMRCYAARSADGGRPLVLLAPGWIRTELGGPNAPFGVEESLPLIVDVLLAQQGRPGLHYLDRHGKAVPW